MHTLEAPQSLLVLVCLIYLCLLNSRIRQLLKKDVDKFSAEVLACKSGKNQKRKNKYKIKFFYIVVFNIFFCCLIKKYIAQNPNRELSSFRINVIEKKFVRLKNNSIFAITKYIKG